MSASTENYLRHILDEIEYLLKESKDLNKGDFIQNQTLMRAFVRSIEIIGEASKKIPEDIKKIYTDIEWKAIAGMRDRLIHDYFGVDYDIVWDVVTNKIPILKQKIERIIKDKYF